KKKKLNYGIYRSGLQSLKHGAITAIGLSVLYGIILYVCTGRYESIVRALEIGGGVGVIAFLWFGGFEVIQHWTLRLMLFLYGILPLRIGEWLKCMHQVNFLQRDGSRLQFQHETLKDYLSSLIPENNRLSDTPFNFVRKKRALLAVISVLLIIIGSIGIYRPINERFYGNKFWTNRDRLLISGEKATYVTVTNNSVRVLKSGIVDLSVSGKVVVGTFVGKIGPEGTYSGFLGFPVNNAYNLVRDFRHGALLYRRLNREKTWHYAVRGDVFYWPWQERHGAFAVVAGDVIEFMVNDNERENDSGTYNLQIQIKEQKRLTNNDRPPQTIPND
ncbi:MAG: hypothetical protein AAGC65_26140, partial [Mucilaginibacter sp.]|uniref:hypothetical protein n=1 Tax=Mucilaginibacter sp. TaxID=1882438 RepID=UPI0031AAF4E7